VDSAGTTVLSEIWSTNPGDPSTQIGPNTRSFDIATLLQSLEGQSIRLNIEQEDNLSFFSYYVDDVSILVSTSVSSGGGGSSDQKWKNKPTFGLSHQTHNQLVQNGFRANGISIDITNNWHTDFEKHTIKRNPHEFMAPLLVSS